MSILKETILFFADDGSVASESKRALNSDANSKANPLFHGSTRKDSDSRNIKHSRHLMDSCSQDRIPKAVQQRRNSHDTTHYDKSLGRSSVHPRRHFQETMPRQKRFPGKTTSNAEHRHFQDTKKQRQYSQEKKVNVPQHGIDKNTKPSDSNHSNKLTKPDTAGQFHGRTLLMGKKVPSRLIPLEPLYLTKPYISSGKKQVRPVDPRPNYYTAGGLEKRIIEQMEDEAKKIIQKSSEERYTNEQKPSGNDADFKLYTIDVKLGNPYQSVASKHRAQQRARSSQSINTLGAELEKRINSQVQVAYKKLQSQGVIPKTVETNLSATVIPTKTVANLQDPRMLITDTHVKTNAGSIAEESSQEESTELIDPWEVSDLLSLARKQPLNKIDKAQLRKEAERQLRVVERRLGELQEDDVSDKEEGEVSHDSDGSAKKIHHHHLHSHHNAKYSPKEESSQDMVDLLGTTLQDQPHPTIFDPWSTPVSMDADYQRRIEDGTAHVRFSTSYGNGSHHNSRSDISDKVYPRSYRSRSPGSTRRSRTPPRDRLNHSRSKSPDYRWHSRSRSPDYRR